SIIQYLVKIEDCHYATLGNNSFTNEDYVYGYSNPADFGELVAGLFIDNSVNVGVHENIFTVTNNTEPGFKNAIFAYNDVDEL
ncbi:MAG: hypothetical protein P5681_26790, partial [Limnospira sp. PMC 894.15]